MDADPNRKEIMSNEQSHPPIVRGGQGRSDEEIHGCAQLLGLVVVSWFVIAALALLGTWGWTVAVSIFGS